MTNIILSKFPKDFDVYVEGFDGGASILLSKQFNNKHIEVYNDLGDNVYALFKVLSDKDAFMRLKERMDLTLYCEKLRNEYKELLRDSISIEDRAYYFLYVNRTSFNGVGGFSTTMLLRRGMSKSTSDYLSMIDNLPQIHNRLSSVIVENKDIMNLIDKYDSENVFVIARRSEYKTFKTNKKLTSVVDNVPFYESKTNFIEAPNNDGICNLNKACFSSELVFKLLSMYCYSKDLVVYDPFMGSGTTAIGCLNYGCNYIGTELSPAQCNFAEDRIKDFVGIFVEQDNAPQQLSLF